MDDINAVFKVLLFLTFSLHLQPADTSTLLMRYTAVTPGNHFTAVGLLDGNQCASYNCEAKKFIPETEWIQPINADQLYWTKLVNDHKDRLLDTGDAVMKIMNQNEGNHTLQLVFGCSYDNNITRGYSLYHYDGEDFIILELNYGLTDSRESWSGTHDKANNFLMEWNSKEAEAKYWKEYLRSDCIDQLNKLVPYNKETLKKKVPPTSSVFQKHSRSSEVVCHATGFFPKEVKISWRKDGEDVKEDVELRETLPNQDGSFQKRIILKVPAEDLQKHKYTCVIQHSSLKEEMVLDVPKGGGSNKETGGGSSGGLMTIIVGVLLTLVALVVLVVAGILVWKKKNSGFKHAPSSEGDSSYDSQV